MNPVTFLYLIILRKGNKIISHVTSYTVMYYRRMACYQVKRTNKTVLGRVERCEDMPCDPFDPFCDVYVNIPV